MYGRIIANFGPFLGPIQLWRQYVNTSSMLNKLCPQMKWWRSNCSKQMFVHAALVIPRDTARRSPSYKIWLSHLKVAYSSS